MRPTAKPIPLFWVHRGHRGFLVIALPFVVGAVVFWAGVLRWLDLAWYDGLSAVAFAFRDPDEREPPVLVAIDDASLRRYGRWPWPRPQLALLLRKIAAGGPKAVGLDILLNDPAPGDEELAKALRLMPVVLAARLDLRRLGKAIVAGEPDPPLPDFAREAAACGFIDFFPDLDRVARRMLTKVAEGPIRLSFAAALARVTGDLPAGTPAEILLSPSHVRPPRVIGAGHVLSGEVDPSDWRGRPVLIGLTAPGAVGDSFATPVRRLGLVPGVYLQACAYATIVRREYLREFSAGTA
ncbi:MAG: CHASE2 domain-containing protein, partial [Firmicutes bacterium]|nr:CHASE2 domain-containing protein [Bacillota bacterium]